MHARNRFFASAVAIVSIAGIVAADVLVVEDPPSAPGVFGTIQSAVDAASDGDVILVRYGSSDGYPGFFVDGKALDIVGETSLGQRPVIAGTIGVANLPAGSRVLLSGLEVVGVSSADVANGYGLVALTNPGRLRVQDCALVGADNAKAPGNCKGFGDESGWEGALLLSCADVAFAHCTLSGGVGLAQKEALGGCWEETSGGDGGHALEATTSVVTMVECELLGGRGGYGATGDGDATGTSGGHGLFLHGTALFASGTRAEGGAGGIFFDVLALPVPGGPGGHGLLSPSSASTMLDCELVGGDGAPGIFGAPDGVDGQPWVDGALTPLAGDARGFTCKTPHTEAQPLLLDFAGRPADAVFVLLSLGDAAIALPQVLHGVLLVANPYVVPIGSLDPSGFLTAVVPIPALDLGVESVTLPLQAVFVQTDGAAFLGPQRHLVLLDDAF